MAYSVNWEKLGKGNSGKWEILGNDHLFFWGNFGKFTTWEIVGKKNWEILGKITTWEILGKNLRIL